ncbi:hypothetical protein M406DRAFT_245590 [Cryphonectria parasitica EP155]|uniref:DUF7580 domain-containing protein n=1 Tax=Cryphonectria parasitica (strain ATCC 38755 / EP155) TaxID=660469 RepID=A0A9P4YAT3_CRYP1|nr:uncharacterized protein M406DRAFT_245590 [Cryphonectria parasitica EP155]KAF3769616.1 hypothetical protein M406DRAFT_245590 [Cryphonectria parasitica EP155]
MSGIDIAGLVLGALALVLKSVDDYKDGIRRITTLFRKRKYVEKLARALLQQQLFLEELIKSVALQSGCEHVLSVQLLVDDPVRYLSDPDIQEELEQFLGPKHSHFLVEELRTIGETVEKVAGGIAGLVPSIQGPKNDLRAIINANKDKSSLRDDLAPRIKLLFGITDINTMIEEIDAGTEKLGRFSMLILSNCKAMGRDPSGKGTKLAKAFRRIRELAGGLYRAVQDGFRDPCHESHEVRLYLDDRIDDASKILRRRDTTDLDTSLLTFDLVFHASNQNSDVLVYRTAVRVLNAYNNPCLNQGDSNNYNNSPSGVPTSGAVTFCVTPASPTISMHQVVTITSICTTIKSAGSIKPRLSFVLMGNQSIGPLPDDKIRLARGEHGGYVSLRQVLRATITTLPIKPRMHLSLQLASSLLQLQHMQWLAQAWSKDTIFFLKPSLSARQTQVDLDKPFITRSFDLQQRVETPSGPRETLLELGILLLEIWHGTTLETRFGMDQAFRLPPTTYYERLGRALEWQDDGGMQGLYGEAVSHCLTGNHGPAGQKLDWEDTKLWGSICGNIIEPLSNLCKQF